MRVINGDGTGRTIRAGKWYSHMASGTANEMPATRIYCDLMKPESQNSLMEGESRGHLILVLDLKMENNPHPPLLYLLSPTISFL